MSSDKKFDIIIIGGGPGGYVAAIRAAQLGMKTAVVEREHLGGVCLNWGCIPTKALLRSADVLRSIKDAAAYGLTVEGVGFDLSKVVTRSRAIASQLRAGVEHLLKKNKVTVFDGHARLAGRGKVAVKGKLLSANHIILATGARARAVPGLEPDGKLVWSYKEAMVPEILPKRLLVVGSGAIGVEFACFFNAFGSRVTVVEAMDRMLPAEDEEISAFVRKSFEKQGIAIRTSATVKALRKGSDEVKVTISAFGKTQDITVDRVILAVGIVGNVEDLGLETTKVALKQTHVVVNEWLETAEPGIYAIGDLAGPPWLAHKASHEGVICVEKIAGLNEVHSLNSRNIPNCTYCHPQVASVGLSETEAREKGYQIKIGRFPFVGNGKAIALGETDGLVKTVFDAQTGELLGAHMVGADVTELIHGYTVAKTLETTETELIDAIFPHPTLSEMMREAVLNAYGRTIHL